LPSRFGGGHGTGGGAVKRFGQLGIAECKRFLRSALPRHRRPKGTLFTDEAAEPEVELVVEDVVPAHGLC
jgi:hypothetical protein